MYEDEREACTRVPRSRLGTMLRLLAASGATSDNGHYVNLEATPVNSHIHKRPIAHGEGEERGSMARGVRKGLAKGRIMATHWRTGIAVLH